MSRPRSGRAVTVALLATLALCGTPAAPADAHGGVLLTSVQAGPYRTQVTAARILGERPTVDYTVYLHDATSGRPVDGARVSTAVEVDGRTVRPAVREIGGGYQALVPVADAADVRGRAVRVEIAGPRGTGRVAIAPATSPGPPAWLLPGTGVLLVLLVVAVLVARRRRATPTLDV